MLWQALMAVRDLGRLHDIATILIRYGFGDLVRRMGLADALERAGRALHWHETEELAHLEPSARVRRALEEMGPTFVKLGQVLATRVDLFEPEWVVEFGKLQDHAPAAARHLRGAAGLTLHHAGARHRDHPAARPARDPDPAAARRRALHGVRPRRGNHRNRLSQRGRTTGESRARHSEEAMNRDPL